MVDSDSKDACKKITHPSEDSCGILLDIKGKNVTIINCYLPVASNNSSARHSEALKKLTKYAKPNKPIIITGDINTCRGRRGARPLRVSSPAPQRGAPSGAGGESDKGTKCFPVLELILIGLKRTPCHAGLGRQWRSCWSSRRLKNRHRILRLKLVARGLDFIFALVFFH